MLGAGALAAFSGLALCVCVFLGAGDLPSSGAPAAAAPPSVIASG